MAATETCQGRRGGGDTEAAAATAAQPHLVVTVGEVLNDDRQDVRVDGVVEKVGVLVAEHRKVRHLLHQLRPDEGLCGATG